MKCNLFANLHGRDFEKFYCPLCDDDGGSDVCVVGVVRSLSK